jgi:hypothetical protein
MGIRRIATSKKEIYGVARQQKVYSPGPIGFQTAGIIFFSGVTTSENKNAHAINDSAT